MTDIKNTIIPRAGDVLASGAICAGPMHAALVGIVAIHPSRLRRAQRFGWQATGATHDDLVEVRRDSPWAPGEQPK